MTTEQEVMNYFLQHIQYYKTTLLKPIKDDAGVLLQDERFKAEFIDRAKWVVISDIVINSKISVDAVQSFIESVNIEELLK